MKPVGEASPPPSCKYQHFQQMVGYEDLCMAADRDQLGLRLLPSLVGHSCSCDNGGVTGPEVEEGS
jgi:hypothetical protein